MPFGSRNSSLFMQKIAQYIARFLGAIGIPVIIYLDDLVGVTSTLEKAQQDCTTVQELLGDLGLPLAKHKVVPPTRQVTWLGVTMDMDKNTIEIQESKVKETLDIMIHLLECRTMSRKQVQSLAGKINHLAKACRPARLFMARILAYLRAHPAGHTPISQGTRADVRWFTEFLPTYKGKSTIPHPEPAFVIEADSCLVGGGAIANAQCYAYEYPQEMTHSMHISQLEAVNCLAAVRTFFHKEHSGATIRINCDNSAAVCIYSTGRGRDCIILACARAMWRHAADTDTNLLFVHIPGEQMGAADTLSRAYLSEARAEAANALIRDKQLQCIHVSDSAFNYVQFI